MTETRFPGWAAPLLEPSRLPQGVPAAWRDGILSCPIQQSDPSIQWYEARGGARFAERVGVPFTMSSLDTQVYHELLARLRPPSANAVILDVGAGDGRNTLPFLRWGFCKVAAVDPVRPGLQRLRVQAQQESADFLDRLLPIQADARSLPLRSGTVDLLLAIESLYYLNEDHPLGLAECVRVLAPGGRLVLAERDWEGALATSLLYGGIGAMLRVAEGRSVWDDLDGTPVRSRVFTEDELLEAVNEAGLCVEQTFGLSVLSVVMGCLRGQGRIAEADAAVFRQVGDLLKQLAENGAARRVHVVIAARKQS